LTRWTKQLLDVLDIDFRNEVAELPAWFDGDWDLIRRAEQEYRDLELLGNVRDSSSVFKLLIVRYPNKHRGLDNRSILLSTESIIEDFCKIPGDLLRKAALTWTEGVPQSDNKFFGKGFPETADLQRIIGKQFSERRIYQRRLSALIGSEEKLRAKKTPTKDETTQEERRAHIAQSLKRTTKDMNDE